MSEGDGDSEMPQREGSDDFDFSALVGSGSDDDQAGEGDDGSPDPLTEPVGQQQTSNRRPSQSGTYYGQAPSQASQPLMLRLGNPNHHSHGPRRPHTPPSDLPPAHSVPLHQHPGMPRIDDDFDGEENVGLGLREEFDDESYNGVSSNLL
jgi:hypothetical protein